MTNYNLFPSTNGPASSTSFGGTIVQGVLFEVTATGYSLQGYRFWRSDSAQSASASFALWQATGTGTGTLVPGSAVSTSSLVAGQWNFVPLTTPIALTQGQAYKAEVGVTGNFPFTSSFYNVAGGVTNGPLTAFPDSGITGHDVYNDFQCTFDTSTSNPSSIYPTTANSSYNCWLDVQVGPAAPVGAAALSAAPALTAAARRVLVAQSALAASPTLRAAPDLVVSFVSTDGNNVSTYNVVSPLNNTGNAGTQQMRVLTPTSPSPSYPHAFLWMLPAEPGQGTTFGDSIATALAINAHNQYNLTIIQPGYATDPWYADNPNDSSTRQESFTLALAAWARTHLGTTGSEKNYAIGFSKSGIGGQGLQFRHPALFAATASWDAPFMMTGYDGTDPDDGTVGGGSAAIYGTAGNFTSNYALSSANLNGWKGPFTSVNRIWLGGFASFHQDVIDYDSLLTSVGIAHTLAPYVSETHAWHTDWVATALAAIIPAGAQGAAALAAVPALHAAGGLLWQGTAHLSAIPALTALGIRGLPGAAHFSAAPALTAPGIRGLPGIAHLSASPLLAATGRDTAMAIARLSAGATLAAMAVPSGPDLSGLWAAFQAAQAKAHRTWEAYRMNRQAGGADGTAGFAYQAGYVAQAAADEAYEAWRAAQQLAFPGARG